MTSATSSSAFHPENSPGKIPPASSTTSRQRFLRACACEPVDRPPVWLMRQAGRALPEYRALKENHSFLELVRTPELAAEVTLQPIRRFGFDAAILFSDILVVPEGMGQPYHFRETGGIDMAFPLRTADDIRRLETDGVCTRLKYVSDALQLLRSTLKDETALIGFAGSPWTLANFMAEGGSAKEWTEAKLLFHTNPALFRELMEKLTTAVTEYLKMQIDAGVDAVQIFDSLGGVLPPHLVEEASACWIRQIIEGLGNRVPVIVFSKGANACWQTLAQTGASVLGVDWTISLSDVARQIPQNVALQGNLDPVLLTTTPETVEREVRRVLNELAGRPGHIFNLGHGVPPTAKLECLEAVAKTVRGA